MLFEMKRFVLVAIPLAIFVNLSLLGQEQSPKAFYIDSTGKLFVSPQVPVHLYMGTKPNGTDAVLLRDASKSNQSLAWNGTGPQLMTHMDLYQGRKIRFELFADGLPPQTSVIPKNINVLQLKDAVIIRGGAIVELSAADEASGTDKIYYSVNGSEFTEYTQPLNLTQDGEYEIRVYATDNLGNREPEVYRKLIVDATPPVTELTIKGDRYEDILSGRAALTLSSTDRFGVEAIHYMLDSSGNWLRYSQPLQTASIKEGYHTLAWYATDKAGNVEKAQSYTFFIDKTPPLVVEEIEGNSYMVGTREFSSGRSRLKIVAVDNKAGVKEIYYSLNNGEFKPYEKPVLLSDILGTVKLKTYAIDRVNNRSQSDANAQSFTMPTIDITGPDMSYRLIGPQLKLRDTLWIGPTTKIELRATDKEAGLNRIEYVLNQNQPTRYFEPFTLKDYGYYSFKCTAYDNVENLNFLNFEVAVDNVAPEIYWHFSVTPIGQMVFDNQTVPVYPSNVRLYLSESDNLSARNSIQYSLNGTKIQNYSTPIASFSQGMNELTITATDELGNSRVETVRFFIK